MSKSASAALEPRKTPVQARSVVTVDAIFEATIQVLLSEGADRLTTTLVAARAGVSVGTLYQYYPNKQALLCAIFQRHMNMIAEAVEAACARARGQAMAVILKEMVEGFIDAKMQRADISTALYRIAADVDGPALARRASLRSQKALEAALRTAPDARLPQEKFAIQMVFAAMMGATRPVLEAGAPPAMMQDLRRHLVLLCQSYMTAAAQMHPRR